MLVDSRKLSIFAPAIEQIETVVFTNQDASIVNPNGVVVQLVRIPACHAGGRGFESRPYRREPTTRGAKRKTSPSYSVNMRGFFRLSCLGLKPRKRQKTTKHLT
jgi:hypothetical protein